MKAKDTIGIMQPYFFPYLGYYQLVSAVDKFIFYDDVSFIKQGWINRNNILLNSRKHLFTVPIKNISSYRTIKDTILHPVLFPQWKDKWTKTIEQAYHTAPFYKDISLLIRESIYGVKTIAELSKKSIINVSQYLDLSTEFIMSSDIYNNSSLNGEARILSICEIEKASIYINLTGGKKLYNKKKFGENGLDLRFLESELPKYKQFDSDFVPGLSMIDILMFNSSSEVIQMLEVIK